MNRIEKLESIRGLAAIYILLHHIYLSQYGLANIPVLGYNILHSLRYGNEAVMIFFVLSGFVIHYSFSRDKNKSFKLFFYKRFARIYIPLIIVFICTAILQVYQYGELRGFTPSRFMGTLLMLQDIVGSEIYSFYPVFDNGPLWSLSYEWWYYMMFFVFATYLHKINRSYPVYILVILSCSTYALYPLHLTRVLMFMIVWWIGRDIAELKLKNKKIGFKSLALPLITIIACIGILNIQILFFSNTLLHVPHYELAIFNSVAFILVIALIWHTFSWRLFNYTIGPFKIFASISYTVYISHMFLIIYASYLDFIKIKSIRISLYIVICFVFSYIVEKKLYPRINRYLRAKLFPK